LHGAFRLQLRAVLHQVPSWSYNGREIVTLFWLAPWAV
jgi:hypothetical protein